MSLAGCDKLREVKIDVPFLDDFELQLISTITSDKLRRITLNDGQQLYSRGIARGWVDLNNTLNRLVNRPGLSHAKLTVEVHSSDLAIDTDDRKDFFAKFLLGFRSRGGRVKVVEDLPMEAVVVYDSRHSPITQ